MKQRLTGPLGELMGRHLQLRRSLGFTFTSAELILDQFDQFTAHHFPEAHLVTKPMVVGYLRTLSHLQPATQFHHLGALRQFCRFLFQLNPDNYVPEKGILTASVSPYTPHIYSPDEVDRLMTSASKLPPSDSLRPHTYVTIIGLLWVSGLRIGEVLRFNLQDVVLEQNLLVVRQSKYFKSRIVPITPSTSSALARYRGLRTHYRLGEEPDAPFFVNERRKRCVHKTVCSTFRVLTRELGLRSVAGNEPRLHDFRHSFATRYLTALYEGGKDPNVALPLLATYLGHVNIACTTVYLHPSVALLNQAGSKFRDLAKRSQGGPDESL
jgi:integrase/recombinase XerD